MTEITLVDGKLALVDDEDVGLVSQYLWRVNDKGYVQSGHMLMHRLVMNAGANERIDHKDRNKFNNQRSTNLRHATVSQNCMNKGVKSTNRSGFKGVTRHAFRDTYQAGITVDGQYIYLGAYSRADQAAVAYDAAAAKYHKEFAVTNYSLGLLAGDLARPTTVLLQRKKSQYRGVSLKNGRYVARLWLATKEMHLGMFDSELDAAHAYDEAARKYFGDRAKLNFPDGSPKYRHED